MRESLLLVGAWAFAKVDQLNLVIPAEAGIQRLWSEGKASYALAIDSYKSFQYGLLVSIN
jgi:hypothetical protein